jgi:alpha-galactosidase
MVRSLKIVVGGRLALTPPMGWNSWNAFSFNPDEKRAKAIADAIVSTGLINHGWTYVNLDTGWGAEQRDVDGHIMPNEKFSDMKALTDYIHSYGLKAGIYSSPGPHVCGPGLGSYQHEYDDAKNFADWGFDYLKYDLCSYRAIAKDQSLPELIKPYKTMKVRWVTSRR